MEKGSEVIFFFLINELHAGLCEIYSQLLRILFSTFLILIRHYPTTANPPIRLSYSPLFRHGFNVTSDPLHGFSIDSTGNDSFSKKISSASLLSISMHKVRCYLKLDGFNEMIRHVLV